MSGDDVRDGVSLTNLDQPLFDGAGAIKRDLVDYLDAVRDQIIGELRDRPLSVIRVLRGQAPFMQKNVPKYTPPWVQTVQLWAETSKREVSYALCNDRRTLLWFANQRAVEYHPTLGRIGSLGHPTYLVLDIDPPSSDRPSSDRPTSDRPSSDQPSSDQPSSDQPSSDRPSSDRPSSDRPSADPVPRGRPSPVPASSGPPSPESFGLAVRAAHLVRQALADAGLAGAVKTSGAKGVHVFVPVSAQATAEDVAAATRAIAARAERLDPEIATTAFIREDREGKVFLDSTRAGGATVAAAYSPRLRPGVPVSFPVAWDELDHVVPADFTVHTAVALLADRDPWRDQMPAPQELSSALIEEGRAIPVARVQAMHEGKRRARARRS